MGRNAEERRGVDKGMKETEECKNVRELFQYEGYG
jgi:hypothetical protein